jgi:EAL domain-containing protein (putative c-di-GMP-specific phosphodiesterase class I)
LALERDELRAHYQPIVETGGGGIVGFEALARWAHPSRGLIRAADFILPAERSGVIEAIGERVLFDAVRHCRSWQIDFQMPGLWIAVNISAAELADADLRTRLQNSLETAGLAAKNLVLEVHPRALGSTDLKTRLLALKDTGARVALDRFEPAGVEITALHGLPFDLLKIAKPSLDHIPERHQDAECLGEAIAQAHALGLDVVAEGVERSEQLDTLKELGSDLVQGYLLGRPQGPERIAALLTPAAPASA